ncbi:MAG TPA: Yip1 family protein [Dehalococcoidia bacterium]|nr:Yip1 family protein [Dehalococcoidia bacterium]
MEKGILDILYQVLASPSKAFGGVSERKPLAWAMLTAIFISVVFALTILPNPPELVEVIFDLEKGSLDLIPVVFIWVIIFLVALFIKGGIFHLIATLLRGRGSYLGIVCGLCFAHFPFVFFAPLTLLRALLGFSGNILYPIGSLIFFLWILVLEIIAIRQNYHFSIGMAIATYFIPAILLIIVPILIVTVIIAL